MKMYILIPDDVPDNYVPVSSAHASLINYKRYPNDIGMRCWLEQSFRKVVVKATHEEIEKAKTLADKFTDVTESNLDGMLVAVSFCPRAYFDPFFKTLPLWKPTGDNNG